MSRRPGTLLMGSVIDYDTATRSKVLKNEIHNPQKIPPLRNSTNKHLDPNIFSPYKYEKGRFYMRKSSISNRRKLRQIRLSMRYGFQDFADLLGLPFGTYSSYEQGTRPLPEQVLKNAQEAQKRDVKFFKELPKRLDRELKDVIIPNEARRGEW